MVRAVGFHRLEPGRETYQLARVAAQMPGQPADLWPALRAELIATLQTHRAWGFVAHFYLEEGMIGEALAAFAESRNPAKGEAPVEWAS